MRELEPALARLKAAWLVGRSVDGLVPDAWMSLVGINDAKGLRLAALAGQALDSAFRPAAPPHMDDPLLPRLDKPTLADRRRLLLRRALSAAGKSADDRRAVIRLLGARGCTAHPADWMPDSGDDWAADDYLRWLNWLAGRGASSPENPLTAENWDDWLPAERKTRLLRLRREKPAAARDLLKTKAPAEPADKRLALLEALKENLSTDDVELVRAFADDRSERVRALMRSLLARLGEGGGPGEAEKELADFFRVGKSGLLARKTFVEPQKLKTTAQQKRRAELFEQVSLNAFAAALGLNVRTLIDAWRADDDAAAANGFAALIARDGAPEDATAYAEAILADKAAATAPLALLAGACGADALAGIATKVFDRDAPPFALTRLWADASPGALEEGVFQKSSAYAMFIDRLSRAPDDKERPHDSIIAAAAFTLGFLADAKAAAKTITELSEAASLPVADPMFDLLRLNAALKPETIP